MIQRPEVSCITRSWQRPISKMDQLLKDNFSLLFIVAIVTPVIAALASKIGMAN